MKKIIIVLIGFCGMLSMNVWAVEEVVITGYYTGYTTTDYSGAAYAEWRSSQNAMATRYGTNWSHQAVADRNAALEQARRACTTSVTNQFVNSCTERASSLHRDAISSCNTGVAVGSTVAAGATAGVAIIAIVFTAPVSVPVLAGAAILTTIGLGGSYVAIDSQFQCKDTAEWTKEDNIKACSKQAAEAAAKSCVVH